MASIPAFPAISPRCRVGWLGEADTRFTIGATMLVALVPFLIVAPVVRKFAPRPLDAKLLPDWPAILPSSGVTIAILVVSAYFFHKDEMERTTRRRSQVIHMRRLGVFVTWW
jgi:hypothetical protein